MRTQEQDGSATVSPTDEGIGLTGYEAEIVARVGSPDLYGTNGGRYLRSRLLLAHYADNLRTACELALAGAEVRVDGTVTQGVLTVRAILELRSVLAKLPAPPETGEG